MTTAEPARAPATPAEWPGFVAELARTLGGLGPGESLVVEVVPEGGLAPSSYYVQFAGRPDSLWAEAVSNAFLPEPAQLRDADTERLTKLGWRVPDAESSPNFSRDWPAPVPYDEVADLAVATLRHIYGAATPADVRTKRVAADTPGIALAPRPDATVESVRAEVEAAMHQILGVEDLKRDENGWAPFEVGSAAVYIRVYGDPPVVQVLSPLLTGLAETPELLDAVNELNANVSFAKIVWTGDAIVASIEMFGAPFTPIHLSHAFSVVAAIADDHDDQLQQRFGGRTALGDFVPPAEPSSVGGYL
ncbi:MAG: T3SS (YopN, CesT) and YbjN peptide-binding chaperone 1 [Actinomycetota bacterium]